MIYSEEQSIKHTKELVRVIGKIKIKGFAYKNEVFTFKGYPIDLSATNPDELSIAYTALKQLAPSI